MASILPEFEYDIFISYRQKDNKYDGWVTDFVTNLKRELEATFKEEVSVYFDENPHDGLLETHNVDKSLERKLKCLVFIPIISQTYCDPRSFAWQHEFLPFNKLARADRFGMNIRLENGNVSSRILPLRIHDLQADDKALLEKELQGTLRPVDFIYRSAGVNRPLRSNEDNPSSNQNKTFYRDQINKVANSVKHIVNGMLLHENPVIPGEKHARKTISEQDKPRSGKVKIGIVTLLLLTITVAGIYWFQTMKHTREVAALRNASIAILPFENQTGQPELNSIGRIAADFISTKLTQNHFWQVIPSQDVFRQTVYSGVVTNPEAEKEITESRPVDLLVVGHYNLIGDTVLLVVSVNDVAERKVLYTTPIIKSEAKNPMKAITDAQQFILGFLSFSTTEKETASTRPPRYDAYQEYLKGMELWTRNEIGPANIGIRVGSEIEGHFKNSITLDPDFLPPYFKLSEIFGIDRKLKRLDSILTILESKKNLFLDGDHMNFTIQKLTISKDWDGLEKFLLTKADIHSKEFHPYYLLAANAVFHQNKPTKALDYIAQCDLHDFDFENRPSDQLLYGVQASALIKLKRYPDVIALIDNLSFKKIVTSVGVKRWLSLAYVGQPALANDEVQNFTQTLSPNYAYQFPVMSLFRAAQLREDTASMMRNYAVLKEFDQRSDPGKNWGKFILAVMMFRTKDNIPEAEKLLLQNLPVVPYPRRIHQLGILYAVTGRPDKARAIIDNLLALENLYDNGILRYFVAKIELALGNKEKSVEYLQQSLQRGMDYGEELFEYDSDFKDLIDYPPFIELVKPKG